MTVMCLPAGARFAEAFARGFWARYGALPPHEIAAIDILLNNHRSVRVVTDALTTQAPGAVLLPRIRVLAELGSDPLTCPDLPPAVPSVRRHLRLIRLVEAFLRREGGSRIAPISAAPDLARSLANLLDECDEIGLPLDELDNAAGEEHAEHWSRSLRFFEVIRTFWPQIMTEEEGGALGPKARQRAVIERLIADWRDAPPRHPVIAAASTGSVATTATLMAAIAGLPQGAVLLPGFDRELPLDIWSTVASGDCPEHPMAPFAAFLGLLDLAPSDVATWSSETVPEARHNLMTQVLRPAPVTDAWHRDAEPLSACLADATASMTLVEAASPRHEAAAIALAVRRALDEPNKTVLILTQDAGLGRRITAELDRFGIEPDDSLGKPLAHSPPGVFLRLIAGIAAGRAGPVEISAFLSHPLFRAGQTGDAYSHIERYERDVLRARGASITDILPDWPAGEPEQLTWLSSVKEALRPLCMALQSGKDLHAVTTAHIAAAERLTTGPDGVAEIWEKEAGAVAKRLFDQLVRSADAFGPDAVTGYDALITSLMHSEEVRLPGQTPHPRVTLMSPRESRVASADLVVLAGLNEGGWPRLPSVDPWLSRPMRAALGLPPPERVIGLSAHDYLQGAMAPEVILTRAVKVEGTPTIPSRWLTRMEILVDGLDRHRGGEPHTIDEMRGRGRALTDLIDLIHHPDEALRAAMLPATRPMPMPPVEARPRRLSVTVIENLIRDAYAVYASKILRLRALDPLGHAPDMRDRGMLIHKILETFTRETPGPLPENARDLFLGIAEQTLSEQIPSPSLRRIWYSRIARFVDWFLVEEARRRADGGDARVEIKGEMPLKGAGEYLITARADRIDLLPDGTAAIYDYKAGAPPSGKTIDAGFNHQLHLQAAILAAGGFEGLQAAEAHLGAYIGLTGSEVGGKETRRENLSAEVAEHLDRVRLLLAAYDRPETPYRSRGMVEQNAFVGEFDHLARVGEWKSDDD
ncbi:double-strand break repair protein AddB [Rhodobacteraceae bacterium NNCM2]|nr:double-strand break repair protein AddB [Coraliihabitans acroporae]